MDTQTRYTDWCILCFQAEKAKRSMEPLVLNGTNYFAWNRAQRDLRAAGVPLVELYKSISQRKKGIFGLGRGYVDVIRPLGCGGWILGEFKWKRRDREYYVPGEGQKYTYANEENWLTALIDYEQGSQGNFGLVRIRPCSGGYLILGHDQDAFAGDLNEVVQVIKRLANVPS